ncbi:hypothetical protein IWQ60_004649, partial [Tieghemiomyces parasiticus]
AYHHFVVTLYRSGFTMLGLLGLCLLLELLILCIIYTGPPAWLQSAQPIGRQLRQSWTAWAVRRGRLIYDAADAAAPHWVARLRELGLL